MERANVMPGSHIHVLRPSSYCVLKFYRTWSFIAPQHMSIFHCVLTRFSLRSHLVLRTLCTFILGSWQRSHHVLHVVTALTVSAYYVFSTFCRLPCVYTALLECSNKKSILSIVHCICNFVSLLKLFSCFYVSSIKTRLLARR